MRGVGTEILGDGQQQIMEACITKGGQGGGGGAYGIVHPESSRGKMPYRIFYLASSLDGIKGVSNPMA